ncbi:hypothetical protein EAI_06379 [Harpegnathos saltator]|uniref:Uncharacterized protein n=1 Tax=Harpegnathos saltator TaxID=610380 RepID=E2BGJ2_HARSA|nr:hypothetical protein EAI_06379 [Harpegnathos saltator]
MKFFEGFPSRAPDYLEDTGDVTGASAEVTGKTEDPRWNTYSTRKTSRSSSPRSWPSSSSLEHAARETRLSSDKHPETTPWGVDRSSPGARSDLSFLETVTEERSEEEDEDGRVQSPGGNDIGDAKIARRNQSISFRNGETNQTDQFNRISVESSSPQSSTTDYRSARMSSTGSSYDIVPTLETRLSTETFSREDLKNTTPTATSMKDITVPRRHMRHAPDTCEKFEIGDEAKGEFYSPNYPDPYPNHIDCVRVLEEPTWKVERLKMGKWAKNGQHLQISKKRMNRLQILRAYSTANRTSL